MSLQAAASNNASYLSSSGNWLALSSSPQVSSSLRPSLLFLKPKYLLTSNACYIASDNLLSLKPTSLFVFRVQRATLRTRAKVDEADQSGPSQVLVQEEEEDGKNQPSEDVEESVRVLKNAAKTRKVAAEEVLSAFSAIEKAKLDPFGFLPKLGGSESPGRTWMLIFTAEKQLKGGSYFPFTAVQRFDAPGKRIENGVYFGPIGCLTFEGRLSWKNRILAFVFECIRIKIGPLKPLEISLGTKDDREPSTKDPFFIWFYVDEEIAVARGRSGGTAFWCRCRRVSA